MAGNNSELADIRQALERLNHAVTTIFDTNIQIADANSRLWQDRKDSFRRSSLHNGIRPATTATVSATTERGPLGVVDSGTFANAEPAWLMVERSHGEVAPAQHQQGDRATDDLPSCRLLPLANPIRIEQLWREYTVGINGAPSLKSLNDRYGCQWRQKGSLRVAYSRRKPLLDEIRRRAPANASAEALRDIAIQLDAERGKQSILSFARHLLAAAKRRRLEPGANSTHRRAEYNWP